MGPRISDSVGIETKFPESGLVDDIPSVVDECWLGHVFVDLLVVEGLEFVRGLNLRCRRRWGR